LPWWHGNFVNDITADIMMLTLYTHAEHYRLLTLRHSSPFIIPGARERKAWE
jgi:hypothetical protein